ncbi:MAG: TetR/AcrR family transcriptional regulator [Chthonomonas sp.]|nr:TetR/AcrR family transcriptional regulator [Chthonomonas sp.]
MAYEIAGNKGLENLHARTIAAELGINHAAVHYYFKTRSDLLSALATYAGFRFAGDLQRVTTNRPTPTQRLEAHIALYEAYARPASRFFRVMAALFVASPGDDKLKGELAKVNSEQVRLLKSDLEAALADGGINPQSPYAHSESLLGYLMGLCYRSQMTPSLDATPMIDQLFASLFRK